MAELGVSGTGLHGGAGPAVGRVRLRTLLMVRWIAIVGQAATLLTVQLGFGFDLPLGPALAAVAASALLNLWLTFHPAPARLGSRGAAMLLAYDVIQLAVLLYLTGGLTNPFALLLLAPISVSATILSRRSTIALGALAIVAASGLAVSHDDLPWPGPGIRLPPLYIAGIWLALVMGVVFIAAYAASLAEEARRMSDALAATQMALAREQRRAAVGALAAAAAHELGSPLSTIAVVAREIAHDLPKQGPLADDAALLLAETGRCRDILARLASNPEDEGATPFSIVPLPALVEAAALPHRRPGIVLDLVADDVRPDRLSPQVRRSPEIIHGLGSLIQNAVQFARARAEVRTSWDEDEVEVRVTDDGPGFAATVLDRLGEPYLSTRTGDPRLSEFPSDVQIDVHMGLGVFIAATLLERTGARIKFRNRPAGGAEATVIWPRARIEYAERERAAPRERAA